MFAESGFYVSSWYVNCEVLVPTQIPVQSVLVGQTPGQNAWKCVWESLKQHGKSLRLFSLFSEEQVGRWLGACLSGQTIRGM